MERLTFKDGRGRWTIMVNGQPVTGHVADRLAAYEDTGLEPEEIQEAVNLFDGYTDDMPKEITKWVERGAWHVRKCDELSAKLRKYEQTASEGRLLVLPCKVGDTVYRPLYGKVWEGIVLNFCFDETVSASIQNVTGGAIVFEHKEDFGKTVFLTREAAEKAMEVANNDER